MSAICYVVGVEKVSVPEFSFYSYALFLLLFVLFYDLCKNENTLFLFI